MPCPNLKITLQINTKTPHIPSRAKFKTWVSAALPNRAKDKIKEITIRIVNRSESATLNSKYRNKFGATNILSFPFSTDRKTDEALLGDLVICAPVVKAEAREQNKSLDAHFAHLAIHGTLHLLGYVHDTKEHAARMEKTEIKILKQLGFSDPYSD
jgi:probable rRNA maturation factor